MYITIRAENPEKLLEKLNSLGVAKDDIYITEIISFMTKQEVIDALLEKLEDEENNKKITKNTDKLYQLFLEHWEICDTDSISECILDFVEKINIR